MIDVKFCTDIRVHQRLNPKDFGDALIIWEQVKVFTYSVIWICLQIVVVSRWWTLNNGDPQIFPLEPPRGWHFILFIIPATINWIAVKFLSSVIIRSQFQSVQYLCLWPHPYFKVYGCRTLDALDLFLSSRTPTSTSWECCLSVSVGGCVHVLHARTYVFPSVSICMFCFVFL